ncbi:MAG TPA: hypothetical protein PKL92_01480 [Aquaticitalea sp.]|nr:hypothetical protein [Aquaticitalea sp.]
MRLDKDMNNMCDDQKDGLWDKKAITKAFDTGHVGCISASRRTDSCCAINFDGYRDRLIEGTFWSTFFI